MLLCIIGIIKLGSNNVNLTLFYLFFLQIMVSGLSILFKLHLMGKEMILSGLNAISLFKWTAIVVDIFGSLIITMLVTNSFKSIDVWDWKHLISKQFGIWFVVSVFVLILITVVIITVDFYNRLRYDYHKWKEIPVWKRKPKRCGTMRFIIKEILKFVGGCIIGFLVVDFVLIIFITFQINNVYNRYKKKGLNFVQQRYFEQITNFICNCDNKDRISEISKDLNILVNKSNYNTTVKSKNNYNIDLKQDYIIRICCVNWQLAQKDQMLHRTIMEQFFVRHRETSYVNVGLPMMYQEVMTNDYGKNALFSQQLILKWKHLVDDVKERLDGELTPAQLVSIGMIL